MRREERDKERQNMEKAPPPTTEPEVTMRSSTEMRSSTDIDRPVSWGELRAVLRGEQVKMGVRTWRPTTGGILTIIAGAVNLLSGIGAVFGSQFLTDLTGIAGVAGTGLGSALIVLGLISIVGGALALMRRSWGIALAGAITALFPSPLILPFIMGTLAMIFVTLGKPEFHD